MDQSNSHGILASQIDLALLPEDVWYAVMALLHANSDPCGEFTRIPHYLIAKL